MTMPDRKKVMSWLEGMAQQDWRMFHSDSEVQEIARNALELLKEQKPVVRCKDCKKWHTNFLPSCGRHGCDVFGDYTKPDDFCSFAERREGR